MKKFNFILFFAVLFISAVSISSANRSGYYDDADYDDKVESPYFIVKNQSGNTEKLDFPLKHTEATVKIAGVIADVLVRQEYINNSASTIEATYVFPGSSKSAVYGMRMIIGTKVIEAKIKERAKAKEEYEKAKAEGKNASLLQQHRPNVFQMDVANIEPGQKIIVELNYTEILIPEDGIYEFVYPTVVGSRYTDAEGAVNDDWVVNPHTNKKENDDKLPAKTFDINITLTSGLPLSSAISTSHKITSNFISDTKAKFGLQNKNQYEGDRDFTLQYKLSGNEINTGIMLYEGENENFFLMMMQPPERLNKKAIPPREYVFIVDVSGSMNGFPIEISKRLIKNLITNLNEHDKFNVILFAGYSAILSESWLPANSNNVSKAIGFIESEHGRGGTEILPALEQALELPETENTSRSIVVATDGLVTVERKAFDLIRNKLGKANLFAFGIGGQMNRYIIEGMAHAGHGEPIMITKENLAEAQAEKFRKYIQSPILTNIKVKYNGFDAYDIEPVSYHDLFANRPLIAFGKWKGDAKGKISLQGYNANGKFQQTIKVDDVKIEANNKALEYLWARHKIMLLSDYNSLESKEDEVVKKEITELGLKYNLLTQYTSFVAIDEQRQEMSDLNHPQSSTAVPEPHEWLLFGLIFIVLVFVVVRRYV